MTVPDPVAAANLIRDLLDGQWVKVIPQTGRRYIGQVDRVATEDDEPVLYVLVNNQEWKVRWSVIERIKLHHPEQENQ